MNYFSLSTATHQSESKAAETPKHELKLQDALMAFPKVLSKEETRQMSALLPYAMPHLIAIVKPKTAGRRGAKHQGRNHNTGENLRFPSPRQASMLNRVYDIIQSATFASISSSVTIPILNTFNFAFSQLDQVSSLAAVFDQYRIAMVEITFKPRANQATGVLANLFYSAVDLDDSTNAASINALEDYPGCQTSEPFKEHKHVFVPHIAVAAYSGVFTSFANETAPWIDVASTAVQHYGVKTGFATSGAVYTYDPVVRMHFQFRNVR